MNTQQQIIEKLQQALAPQQLEVINESHMHNVPEQSETHFKVVIVSDLFEGESLVKRHRRINALLSDELAGGVHALGLHTLTCAEWEKRQGQIAASPRCLGGAR